MNTSNKVSKEVASASDFGVSILVPTRGWVSLDLAKVWQYRELLFFLTWRDVKVRYKQTVLGAAWAIIQPFLTMVVFTVIFGRLANLPSDGVPYPLMTYAALLPWTFFANGISKSSDSLVGSANLIKKVYFPRLIMPLSNVLSGLVDFALASLVLLGMMAYYGYYPSANCVYLPLLLLLAMVTSLGVGLWLSAMNVQFRDVKYAVPFLVQFWMYVSPVAYSATIIPERWRTLYALNPMVGVVTGFRWALLRQGAAPGSEILISCVVACAFVLSGAYYFRRMEKTFADVV